MPNVDDYKHDRKTDGRYAKDEETEKEMVADVLGSNLSLSKLADKWGVSKAKIWNIRNPEKAKANVEARKNNYKGRYYNTKEARETKAKCRAKKKKLMENKDD